MVAYCENSAKKKMVLLVCVEHFIANVDTMANAHPPPLLVSA